MLIDWLYRTTIEISLLIGLVLLIRPLVRRVLGAHVAYWLWFIPLLRLLIADRPARPTTVLEAVSLTNGRLDIGILPNPDVLVLPDSIPLIILWVAGVAGWIAIRALGLLRFRWQLRQCASIVEPAPEILASLPKRLLAPKARYYACSLPGTPFLCGLLRPAVFLPEDFELRFSASEQKCIIQHELSHHLRRDLWMLAAWELLRALFWFNPIVHIAAIALRDDQEFSCDRSVLAGYGSNERFHYARALAIEAGPYLLPPAMTFFGNRKERMIMIERHKPSRARTFAGLVLCALVATLSLTKAPRSIAQEELGGDPVSLSFQLLSMEAVIQLLADFSGTNIVGTERVRDVTVSLRMRDVPWRSALVQLLNCVDHTFETNGDTLEIVPLASPDDARFECENIEIESAVP